MRIKSEWEQCTRTRPRTKVLFVQCCKFTKFLDKKVFFCFSDFLFSPFILRRSFIFFFMCLRCAGILALTRAQLHPATYHYTQTPHQCFDLTLKFLGFCFLYKMVSVLRSHQVSWQVLHTRACSCYGTSYLVR